MKIKQINNIQIHQLHGKFFCRSPQGYTLEEFDALKDAEQWCKDTEDFLNPDATLCFHQFTWEGLPEDGFGHIPVLCLSCGKQVGYYDLMDVFHKE